MTDFLLQAFPVVPDTFLEKKKKDIIIQATLTLFKLTLVGWAYSRLY